MNLHVDPMQFLDLYHTYCANWILTLHEAASEMHPKWQGGRFFRFLAWQAETVDNHWYNLFWVWDIKFSHFSPKKVKFWSCWQQKCYRNSFQAILSLRKSMGGIVKDIWEKSNFFGSIGSQKGAKNAIFLQGGHLKPPLPLVGLKVCNTFQNF